MIGMDVHLGDSTASKAYQTVGSFLYSYEHPFATATVKLSVSEAATVGVRVYDSLDGETIGEVSAPIKDPGTVHAVTFPLDRIETDFDILDVQVRVSNGTVRPYVLTLNPPRSAVDQLADLVSR